MRTLLAALIMVIGFPGEPDLPLEKRTFNWQPCTMGEPAVMGLSEDQFIQHKMYMEALWQSHLQLQQIRRNFDEQ